MNKWIFCVFQSKAWQYVCLQIFKQLCCGVIALEAISGVPLCRLAALEGLNPAIVLFAPRSSDRACVVGGRADI